MTSRATAVLAGGYRDVVAASASAIILCVRCPKCPTNWQQLREPKDGGNGAHVF